MSEVALFQENNLKCTSKSCRQEKLIHKGTTVIYEGSAFKVMRVTPFLVIKCGNRVVCGNLFKQIKLLKS